MQDLIYAYRSLIITDVKPITQTETMEGYAKISRFMGDHPESAMVLRFSDINIQNILYLQAEIYGLLEDLRLIEKHNRHSSIEDIKHFPLDWYALAKTLDDDGKTNKQWEKVQQLRPLLKEYSKSQCRCFSG